MNSNLTIMTIPNDITNIIIKKINYKEGTFTKKLNKEYEMVMNMTLTTTQLRDICKINDIKYYTKLKKLDIIRNYKTPIISAIKQEYYNDNPLIDHIKETGIIDLIYQYKNEMETYVINKVKNRIYNKIGKLVSPVENEGMNYFKIKNIGKEINSCLEEGVKLDNFFLYGHSLTIYISYGNESRKITTFYELF